MPVAIKTLPARRHLRPAPSERRASPPVSRRRKRMRSVILARTVSCVLGMLFLLGYVGLYAQVTLYGYRRADLANQIRQAEMVNQDLRAQIQILTGPDRLAAVAATAGMEPTMKVVCIPAPARVKVAKAD